MCLSLEDYEDNIVQCAASYRLGAQEVGEIMVFDRDHVVRWVEQFDVGARVSILRELAYVLQRSYISREMMLGFVEGIAVAIKDSVNRFSLLSIQHGGQSQEHLVEILNEKLVGLIGTPCDINADDYPYYIYIDDVLFSGGRVKNDITAWLENSAPESAVVYIVLYGAHTYGEWKTGKSLREAATRLGKNIQFEWRKYVSYENRKTYTCNSDVLRPKVVPDYPAVQRFCAQLPAGDPQVLRAGDFIGPLLLYSSGAGKDFLEQEFFKKGAEIVELCRNLNQHQRPLGNCTFLNSYGFGSLVVTYRNCPNNAPLALWVGHPWYPLFPRVTN